MFWVVAKLPFGSIGFSKHTLTNSIKVTIEFATPVSICFDQFVLRLFLTQHRFYKSHFKETRYGE